jgi:hypothetical protein
MAIASLVRLAGHPPLREAEHGHLLAAQAVSRPLDAIEPTGYTRPTTHRPGDPRPDSQGLAGQSFLGISPRIQSELRKLGIDVAKSTVEKYRVRPRKPPSPSWRAFLANHTKELVSLDFFTVSTVRFHVLFVLIILAHDRRRVVHFNITKYPTARWTAQQVVEAFPWDSAPRFLFRDRDGVYGADFRRRVQSMGIEEVIIAPRGPVANSLRGEDNRQHPSRMPRQRGGAQ